jgi:hypothetical protein
MISIAANGEFDPKERVGLRIHRVLSANQS